MRAVHEHEMKHYSAVYSLSKQYREFFQTAIIRFIRETGVRGPYLTSQKDALLAERENRLAQIMEALQSSMQADNVRLQATIDNVAEYQRVANLCRG